jgi:DNA-directed RNA polymerase specialized sigma24 family protein
MASDFPFRAPGDNFPTTRHSAVAAVGSDDPAQRARAFEALVRAYSRPAYAHVRMRWRRPSEDARDLVQGFFARAFEKRFFAEYDPDKALFRTYLKTCLDRFVMDADRDEKRLKRGGGTVTVSLDFDLAERELARFHGADAATIEGCFDAEWARHLLGAGVERLEALTASQGKQAYFEVFRRYVLERDEGAPSYAELAAALGLRVTDVTNYLAWTRREFRKIVLEELREITVTDDEYRAEARGLLGIEP